MSWFVVDVEADGPIPGDYSMVSFGAVLVTPELNQTFFGQCRPISENHIPRALSVSGYSREECMDFPDPKKTMTLFHDWVMHHNKGRRAFFASDNNGFDWQFINWYFHHFLGENPFGHSSSNLNSVYKGMTKNMHKNIKHMRKTKHTHHPVDDAKGNAEAFLEMRRIGLK